MRREIHFLGIAQWIAYLYMALSVILIPWTSYLAVTLPSRHLTPHWDVIWVGIDAAIICTLMLTAYLTYKNSKWVAVVASSAATLLIVDAWFDVVSERSGRMLHEALFAAMVFELPLALLTYFVAYRSVRYYDLTSSSKR